MFPKVDIVFTVDSVINETGYKSKSVLKTIMTRFRNDKFMPKDKIIDLKLDGDKIRRVK